MTHAIPVKAAAIADLLSGDQPAAVAARYGLNAATVRSWKKRLGPIATEDATHTPPNATVAIVHPALADQQRQIGDLIIQALEAKLLATQRIAEHVASPAWLSNQTAADVAELFAAIDMSAIAMLDRMARHHDTTK